MPIFGKKKDKPQTGPSEAQSGSPVPENQNRSPTQAVGGSKDGHSGPAGPYHNSTGSLSGQNQMSGMGGPYHNSTGSLSGQNQMSGMGMNLGMGHGASGSVGPSGMPGYGGPQQGPPGSQMVQAPHMQQGGPNQGSMGPARGLGMGGPAGSGGPGQLGGSSMAMQPGMMAPGQGSNVPMGPQGPQIGMNGSNGNLMMGSGPSPVGSLASGPPAGQAGMGPAGASTGPPGAASGFKFGAQTRQDGGASAIPGQVARTRKASEDGAGPGISGLPPSSGPNVGPPVGMQGSTDVGGVPTAGPGGSNIGAGASNAPPRPQGSSAVLEL
ncbi:hypothetical protein CBOM_04943 [Ceraceosorus bombacis]|uniref:Uncharacterized protein n=1 Tax=Ceraceosorus bombacis TaxID=401625 RepID=A0A0N7LA65_9BASI|nr:hypothetical protein CBOM_04943 [Ceraceosorus bombacis]